MNGLNRLYRDEGIILHKMIAGHNKTQMQIAFKGFCRSEMTQQMGQHIPASLCSTGADQSGANTLVILLAVIAKNLDDCIGHHERQGQIIGSGMLQAVKGVTVAREYGMDQI